MAEAVIGKRPFHTFLGHAHVDKERADEIFQFLNDVAGIPVWYDAVNLPPGATIADNLYEAIESSRSAMILLSRTSVQRGWVQQELRAALNQQALHRDFRIVPLRLDDVEPPNFLPPGRPSFMLRDQQVWDYGTDAELVAGRTSLPGGCGPSAPVGTNAS